MGITREMSKILSTSTAITTDAEISAYNYLSQSTASATYLNQAAYQPGLVLIAPTSVVGGTINASGTVTFSNSSAISLNGIFSSTYRNYYMAVNVDSGTSNNNLLFRFRVSNADNTSNVYRRAGTYAGFESGVSGFDSNVVNTYWYLGTFLNGSYPNTSNVEIMNPFIATRTYAWTRDIGNGGTYFSWNYGNIHTEETSFTGCTVYTDGGSVTGTISVYGYRA